MSSASEYNVIGGILGLGNNIMMDILSEVYEMRDFQEIIVVCKKTYCLKDHFRFYDILTHLLHRNTFTRALIIEGQDEIETVINPLRTETE